VLAAQKFYETHDDAYDYLIIYNDLGVAAAPGAIAYEVTVRNHRSGYGDRQVDVGAEFGSPSRLQAVLNMGPLSQYPVDPDAAVPGRAVAGDTPLTILAHEAGHLFLAYASIRDPNRPEARPMLGRQRAHWNFSFNSEASLLEGNRICDRERTPDQCPPAPPSGRFVTTATVEGYSPLDQYLMGFRPWWEVPDTFLVENSTAGDPSRQPQAGVAFDGQRRDIRIEEIIDAEGRRTPDYRVSQRRFRFAFLLIVAAGSEPSAAALEQIDRYRREFEEFYHQASGGRAWAETRLERALHLSAFPAAGLLLGSAGRATISIEHPAAGRLDVLLSSREGAVQIPAGVTIPAGETTASVPMTGVRAASTSAPRPRSRCWPQLRRCAWWQSVAISKLPLPGSRCPSRWWCGQPTSTNFPSPGSVCRPGRAVPGPWSRARRLRMHRDRRASRGRQDRARSTNSW